jgi:hypothetical protein
MKTSGRFAVVTAVSNERSQVGDDVLKRMAVVLLALCLNVSLNIGGGKTGKVATGAKAARQKISHCRSVMLQRLRRESSHVTEVLQISAAQQAQRVYGLLAHQTVCGSQESGEEAASAQVYIGIRSVDDERLL